MSDRKASADRHVQPGYNPALGSLVQQMGDLGLQPARSNYNINEPVSIFSSAATRNFRSMSFGSQPLIAASNERSYLIENLRRQHSRGERLSHALSNVETRLASASSKGEARRLRKEAGLLRSKVAESRKQEQLITMRLNDLQNEDLKNLYQAQQPDLFPYSYPPPQPWGQIPMSPMTSLTPISPLTPLPDGIYHPAPIPPSPLNPPFLFSPTYSVVTPVVPYEQGVQVTGNDQGLPAWVSERSDDGTLAKLEGVGGHSVLAEPVRRWSLADAFSPSPKDKRMSMPGLKTIWRFP
ncbi:hypothetical protein diail_145 [Diaporthe ilicicola]|nr:hypothetical protein diail_145 [Diaporthe ilicicola]